MKKVKIFADSTCDLSPELLERYEIGIVPLYINMEGKSLRDGIEVDVDMLFESFNRTKKLPKTSAPSPGDVLRGFSPYLDEGYEIVHITINSNFSVSYQNACMVASEHAGIYVVDSSTLSTSMGLLVIRAAEMAQNGLEAREIFLRLTELKKKSVTNFIVDTLEYAYKGGRCSMLTAFGANLLKLRPCFHIDGNGIMTVIKKFRGNFSQVALDYTKYVMSLPNIDYQRLFISYTQMSEEVLNAVVKCVKELSNFKEILITKTGCTIATHGGPNTLALFYMNK